MFAFIVNVFRFTYEDTNYNALIVKIKNIILSDSRKMCRKKGILTRLTKLFTEEK